MTLHFSFNTDSFVYYSLSFFLSLYRGLITLKDKVLVLEPAQKPNSTLHHIFRGEHLTLKQGTCGHGHNVSHTVRLSDNTKSFFSSHGNRVS